MSTSIYLRGNLIYIKTTTKLWITKKYSFSPLAPSSPNNNNIIIIPFTFSLISDLDPHEYKIEDKYCPGCLESSNDFIHDPLRAERFCPACGLVGSMSYPFVAGERVQNPCSYDYSVLSEFNKP